MKLAVFGVKSHVCTHLFGGTCIIIIPWSAEDFGIALPALTKDLSTASTSS